MHFSLRAPIALTKGKCSPISGLGFRLTQARGRKLTTWTKIVAMLCFCFDKGETLHKFVFRVQAGPASAGMLELLHG